MFGKKDRDKTPGTAHRDGADRPPRPEPGPEHDDVNAPRDGRAAPRHSAAPIAGGSSPASPDDDRTLDLGDRERTGAHYRSDGIGPTAVGSDGREPGITGDGADETRALPVHRDRTEDRADYVDPRPEAPADHVDPRTGDRADYVDPRTSDRADLVGQRPEDRAGHVDERLDVPRDRIDDDYADRRPEDRADYVDAHRTAAYDDERPVAGTVVVDRDGDGVADTVETADERRKAGYRINPLGGWLLGLLRILLGVKFLWVFVDKTFGLGLSTPRDDAWINGGRPSEAFLESVVADDSKNPFKPMFRFFLEQPWVDWVFMIGLAGIGIALILGVAMWFTAICAAVLLTLLYLASWPLTEHPFIDEHLIYAVSVLALAACNAGAYIGLGRAWKTRRAHR